MLDPQPEIGPSVGPTFESRHSRLLEYIEAQPTSVAEGIRALVTAGSVHEERDRLVECFRALVRIHAVIALATVIHFGLGPNGRSTRVDLLFDQLRSRDLTDGQWIELVREVLQRWEPSRAPLPIPDLATAFFARDDTRLDPVRALLEMRNQAAHQRTGTAEQVRRTLSESLPCLASLLRASAQFWEHFRLVGGGVDESDANLPAACLLHGPTPLNGAWKRIEISSALPPADVALIDGGGRIVLNLSPFARFDRVPDIEHRLVHLIESVAHGRARHSVFPLGLGSRMATADARLAAFAHPTSPRRADDASDAMPFRGLESFRTEDRRMFFGREADVDRVASLLRQSRFVTLTGPSGVGKTSLLYAGVIPRLCDDPLPSSAESPYRDDRRTAFRVVMLRPGSHPMRSMHRALSLLSGPGLDQPDPPSVDAIVALAARLCATLVRPLLIVIDQGEELFTQCTDVARRDEFGRCLGGFLERLPDQVWVVLSLREDFFGRFGEVQHLKDLYSGSVAVLAMPSADELAQCVLEPLRLMGIQLEAPLQAMEMATVALSSQAGLPLLQFAAKQLWEHRDRPNHVIPEHAYRAMGGVQGALSRHADMVLGSLSPPQRSIARGIFLRLVTSAGTRAVVAQQDLLGGNHSAVRPVLETLINQRLVVARGNDNSDAGAVELVHEVLLSAWETLKNWRQQEEFGKRTFDWLRFCAVEWNNNGRAKRYLWHSESMRDLERALRGNAAASLTPLQEQFMQNSRKEVARQRFVRGAHELFTIFLVLVIAWIAARNGATHR